MDWILAFSAGLLSFLSPCVLPLIPLYFSHLVGSAVVELESNKERLRLLLQASWFSGGFSIVFILLGVSVSVVSQLLDDHLDWIRIVGGLLIILFGVHMTGLFTMKWLQVEKRNLRVRSRKGWLSSLLLGMAFAVGWTPCIGPILSTILIYAGSMETVGKGTLLLVVYCAGFAIPLLLCALLVEKMRLVLRKISKYLPLVSIVCGILMIVIGILVLTNKLEVFSRYGSLFNI